MGEIYDTGLSKIKQEIKSRLVHHGLFGSVTNIEIAASEHSAIGTKIQIIVKDRTADRTFTNEQIEACCLRVAGPVLAGILSMVDELSA
jgi:GMP synthase PP-ATPase subunit